MVSNLTRPFCSKEYCVFCEVESLLLSESLSSSEPDQSLVTGGVHLVIDDSDNIQFTFEMREFYNHVKMHFSSLKTGSLAHEFVSLHCNKSLPQVFKLFKYFSAFLLYAFHCKPIVFCSKATKVLVSSLDVLRMGHH